MNYVEGLGVYGVVFLASETVVRFGKVTVSNWLILLVFGALRGQILIFNVSSTFSDFFSASSNITSSGIPESETYVMAVTGVRTLRLDSFLFGSVIGLLI